jgi:hypothetical protein
LTNSMENWTVNTDPWTPLHPLSSIFRTPLGGYLLIFGGHFYQEDHYSLDFDSPPTSLEPQRSQRYFSYNFLLRPAKEQWDINKGRKLKNQAFRAIVLCAFFTPSRIWNFLRFRLIILITNPSFWTFFR